MATVIILANVIHVKFGEKWQNPLEEIGHPATLLIIELIRQCRAAFLRESAEVFQLDFEYSVLWCIVTTFWLFSNVST